MRGFLLNRLTRLLLLLLPATLSLQAHGEGWKFDSEHIELGKFSLGLASAIAAHELGHYVVATSKGYKVGHDGLSIIYPDANFSPGDQLQVASAGFQTQWLLAELVLRNSSDRRVQPSDLSAGVVSAHLAITATYIVTLKDHKLGDVVGMAEATGLSNNQIMLGLAIPGVLDAWRLFGNDVPTWVPELSMLGKGLGMAWVWTY